MLIIRPSALGDVCRSVPVAASLHAAWPHARIDWLVQEGFGPAIEAHPAVANVIDFPRHRGSLARLATRAGRESQLELLRLLRRNRYDLVLDCQGLLRSGFFALASGARRRVGYPAAWARGGPGPPDGGRPPRSAPPLDRMLALVEHLGIEPRRDITLHVRPADAAALPARLRGARFVVLAPTSRWPGKRWPIERFAELAAALLGRGDVDALAIVASAAERDQCAALLATRERDPRVVDLVGGTSVGGLLAVVDAAALVVANDSAALHMAAGLHRPLVGLFGPTRIERVGPYGRDRDVLQAAPPPAGVSHKDDQRGAALMAAIPTQDVVEACAARLDVARSPALAEGA